MTEQKSNKVQLFKEVHEGLKKLEVNGWKNQVKDQELSVKGAAASYKGKAYAGPNRINLMLKDFNGELGSNVLATFERLQARGLAVERGQKGQPIYFAEIAERKLNGKSENEAFAEMYKARDKYPNVGIGKKNGEPVLKIPTTASRAVFNLSQLRNDPKVIREAFPDLDLQKRKGQVISKASDKELVKGKALLEQATVLKAGMLGADKQAWAQGEKYPQLVGSAAAVFIQQERGQLGSAMEGLKSVKAWMDKAVEKGVPDFKKAATFYRAMAEGERIKDAFQGKDNSYGKAMKRGKVKEQAKVQKVSKAQEVVKAKSVPVKEADMGMSM